MKHVDHMLKRSNLCMGNPNATVSNIPHDQSPMLRLETNNKSSQKASILSLLEQRILWGNGHFMSICGFVQFKSQGSMQHWTILLLAVPKHKSLPKLTVIYTSRPKKCKPGRMFWTNRMITLDSTQMIGNLKRFRVYCWVNQCKSKPNGGSWWHRLMLTSHGLRWAIQQGKHGGIFLTQGR